MRLRRIAASLSARSRAMTVGLLATVLSASCGDATAPRAPLHPIVGTYALTTRLQTYTYPVNCLVSCTMATVANRLRRPTRGPSRSSPRLGVMDMVRLLVERGARLDVADTVYEGTPLGWALHGGRTEIAAYLQAVSASRH